MYCCWQICIALVQFRNKKLKWMLWISQLCVFYPQIFICLERYHDLVINILMLEGSYLKCHNSPSLKKKVVSLSLNKFCFYWHLIFQRRIWSRGIRNVGQYLILKERNYSLLSSDPGSCVSNVLSWLLEI